MGLQEGGLFGTAATHVVTGKTMGKDECVGCVCVRGGDSYIQSDTIGYKNLPYVMSGGKSCM